MVKLLNSLYLGASTPDDYGQASGVVELLPFNLYLGAAVPSGGHNFIDVILSGVSPLVLTNAIAGGLNYLKLFGGAEQRNLPSGYVQNQFIWMKEASYLLTDVVPSTGGHYEFDFATTSVSSFGVTYFGARNVTAVGAGFRIGHAADKLITIDGFGTRYASSVTFSDNTRYKFVWNNGVGKILQGSTEIVSNTFTSTETITYPVAINALNDHGTFNGNVEGIYFYGFKAWNTQGELVADCLPATKLQGLVTGIYDRVKDVFITATSGEWSSGPAVQSPSPDTPMDIVCNNGVVKVNTAISGKNAIDTSDIVAGYISPTTIGTPVVITESLATNTVKKAIRCEINKKYVFKYVSNLTGQRAVIIADDNGNALTVYEPLYCNIGLNEFTLTATATGWYWLGIQSGDLINVQPEIYEVGQIYTDGTVEQVTDSVGNTANAERLLAVGDYKDTQEVLNGGVTRNIGIKVLDGTENWTKSGSGTVLDPIRFSVSELIIFPDSNTIECLSTHYPFSGVAPTGAGITLGTFNIGMYNNIHYIRFAPTDITTVTGWTDYLKDQYKAGTPVIIVYPLATATTESVTGQPLTVQQGTNIVEITQASMDGLTMEVSYKAGVTVTITEVENAQLDNSVEVTING